MQKNDWALAKASMKGHYQVVKYLIKCGANVNSRNNQAIIKAFKSEFTDIVNILVKKGAMLPNGINTTKKMNSVLMKKYNIKVEKLNAQKFGRIMRSNKKSNTKVELINDKYNYTYRYIRDNIDYVSDDSYDKYHSCDQSESDTENSDTENSDDDWMDNIEVNQNNNCPCQYSVHYRQCGLDTDSFCSDCSDCDSDGCTNRYCEKYNNFSSDSDY